MEPWIKSLRSPDEVIRLPGITEELVDLGDLTIGRVVSGSLGLVRESGTEYMVSAFDAYDLPPGHDGYVIGDEPAVVLDWSGLRTIAGTRAPARRTAWTPRSCSPISSTPR